MTLADLGNEARDFLSTFVFQVKKALLSFLAKLVDGNNTVQQISVWEPQCLTRTVAPTLLVGVVPVLALMIKK